MTKRTRLFLSVATGVLTVGLGTGIVASYMGLSALPIIGDAGPVELAYVPSDARLVGFADVRDIMNSELRQKFHELRPHAPPNSGFEQQTGINVETDIDHVVVAMLGGTEGARRSLVLARGRFDEVRIEQLIRDKGGRVEDYKGNRLLVLADQPESVALSFVEPGLVVFGRQAAVRLAIDTKASDSNVTDNADIMNLAREVDDGSAWAVGRFDALASGGQLPANVVEQLPPIDLFAASGHINGGLRATLRAEARDDVAAQNLRDVVRGFIALARLQSGRNERLLTLLNSVELAGDGKTVALSLTIPATAIDLLAPHMGRSGRQAHAAF
jgi:hypothetical protein